MSKKISRDSGRDDWMREKNELKLMDRTGQRNENKTRIVPYKQSINLHFDYSILKFFLAKSKMIEISIFDVFIDTLDWEKFILFFLGGV